MKPLAARLFASILMAITAAATETPEPPSAPDGSLTFRPHPTLSQRQFVIEGRETPAKARIGVFRLGKNNRVRVQTLHGPDSAEVRLEILKEVTWRVEDLNFDGYRDVGLLWNQGGSGNLCYYFWIFNPATGRFVLNEALSEMANVEVDKKRRIVRSHEAHRFGYEEFRWRKGKLVRTKYVSEEEGLRMNAGAR